MLYLAEIFGAFFPSDHTRQLECLSWLFWQMGSGPYLGSAFGHFYVYAPLKMVYPINRFAVEVKCQLDVLDRRLADDQFLCGDEYTIADIATWPWYGALIRNQVYEAAEFLDAASYKNLFRWTNEIGDREAGKRVRLVNRKRGPLEEQIHERHDADDSDTKTQDKLQASS